ncbi:MAG: flavodoxin domain-containing protein [Kineosporiaceae bacterium]
MSNASASPGARVLVAAASRHGSTREMAAAIGEAIASAGIDATVARIEDDPAVAGYDAVVLGSAVYIGHWVEAARRFVEAHRAELAGVPTWLFSSGPIGSPAKPDDARAVDVSAIVEMTGAREHRLFAGRLDTNLLGFGERAVIHAVRARPGDYRDWDEIRAWGAGIAEALSDGGA